MHLVINKKKMNYLDRNEFNFEPSQKVLDAVKNFDVKIFVFIPVFTTKERKVLSVSV